MVEIWLSDRTVSIGDRTFARVRVSNRGSQTVYRQTGGNCGVPVRIQVDLSALVGMGRIWERNAARFKRWVLGNHRPGQFRFEPVEFSDLGTYGCPDHFSLDAVRPGSVIDHKYAWDAKSEFGNPIVPGTAKLTATFPYFRDRERYKPADERVVSVATTMLVEGSAPPGQRPLTDYIDIALGEPRFAAWLDEKPARLWMNINMSVWPNEDGEYPPDPIFERTTESAVMLGLHRRSEFGGVENAAVIIDVPSGRVLGFERDNVFVP